MPKLRFSPLILLLLRYARASPFMFTSVATREHAPKGEPVGSPEFWWKMAISAALVLGGGVFAG